VVQLEPGLDGRLLDGVLGGLGIVEHGAGQAIAGLERGLQHGGKGDLIAAPCRLN